MVSRFGSGRLVAVAEVAMAAHAAAASVAAPAAVLAVRVVVGERVRRRLLRLAEVVVGPWAVQWIEQGSVAKKGHQTPILHTL